MKYKYQKEIYEYLATIPKGKVVTYGQIAKYLGNKGLSRYVGNILHINPEPFKYPCFKVVNSKGHLAENFGSKGGIETQKKRLENDGVEVIDYTVDLSVYQCK